MITKLNIGLAISRNFNKVTLEFLDEPIEYDTDEELKAKIRQRFSILKEEVDLEFTKI